MYRYIDPLVRLCYSTLRREKWNWKSGFGVHSRLSERCRVEDACRGCGYCYSLQSYTAWTNCFKFQYSMWSNLSDSRTQSQICCDNKRTQRQWQPHKLDFMALFAPEISHSIEATVIQSHKSVHKSMVFTLYSLLRLSDGDHSTFQLCRPRLINAREFFSVSSFEKEKTFYLQTSSILYWIQHNEFSLVNVFRMCDHHHRLL